MVTAAMKQKTFASWQESYNKPRQGAEKKRHDSDDKGPCGQAVVSLVIMCSVKSQRLPAVVLEKTPKRPLDSKEIKPGHLMGNQP